MRYIAAVVIVFLILVSSIGIGESSFSGITLNSGNYTGSEYVAVYQESYDDMLELDWIPTGAGKWWIEENPLRIDPDIGGFLTIPASAEHPALVSSSELMLKGTADEARLKAIMTLYVLDANGIAVDVASHVAMMMSIDGGATKVPVTYGEPLDLGIIEFDDGDAQVDVSFYAYTPSSVSRETKNVGLGMEIAYVAEWGDIQ